MDSYQDSHQGSHQEQALDHSVDLFWKMLAEKQKPFSLLEMQQCFFEAEPEPAFIHHPPTSRLSKKILKSEIKLGLKSTHVTRG